MKTDGITINIGTIGTINIINSQVGNNNSSSDKNSNNISNSFDTAAGSIGIDAAAAAIEIVRRILDSDISDADKVKAARAILSRSAAKISTGGA